MIFCVVVLICFMVDGGEGMFDVMMGCVSECVSFMVWGVFGCF